MRILITGINGFVGSHLAALLLTQAGTQIWGNGLGRLEHGAPPDARITYDEGDLTDPVFAADLLARSRPDAVFHLAGQASPPLSWQDPWATIETNIRAELNILEAAARSGSSARILVVGSIDEYGRTEARDLPLTEDSPLRPESPYALSKIGQDFAGLQYFISHGVQVVRVRPANHIGPGQSPQFVTANFAKQIAEIEAGMREAVLRVGNLDVQRDFSDVRDVVRAYVLALDKGLPGEVYNVGSGRPVAIRTIVDILLSLSRVDIRVEPDPSRLRPADTPVLYCSAAKLRDRTGWNPRIPLEETLRDILGDWRARASRGKET